MTNEERMRVVEINVDVNKGRVPLIAGCHHQNPLEAAKLAQHAQDTGIYLFNTSQGHPLSAKLA